MSIFVRYYAQGFTQIYLDLLELWAGRVAGALTEDDYTKKLAQTGFNQIGIETAWLYGLARERLSFLVRGCCRQACQGARRQRDGKIGQGFARGATAFLAWWTGFSYRPRGSDSAFLTLPCAVVEAKAKQKTLLSITLSRYL